MDTITAERWTYLMRHRLTQDCNHPNALWDLPTNCCVIPEDDGFRVPDLMAALELEVVV